MLGGGLMVCLLCLLYTCVLLCTANYFQLTCPVANHRRKGNQHEECTGRKKQFHQFSRQLYPGYFTISSTATQPTPGSVMQVSLYNIHTRDRCILLDNIPFNTQHSRRRCERCQVDKSAANTTQKKPAAYNTYITVKLPDVRCDRCLLSAKLVSRQNGTCDSPTCGERISCSNVILRGSHHFKRCPSLTRDSDHWPYDSMESTQSALHTPTGFLTGGDFIGSSASVGWAAAPVGPCAPKQTLCTSMLYRSMLHKSDHLMGVALEQYDDRVSVTAVIPNRDASFTIQFSSTNVTSPKKFAVWQTVHRVQELRSGSQTLLVTRGLEDYQELLPCDTDTKHLAYFNELKSKQGDVGGLVFVQILPATFGIDIHYVVANSTGEPAELRGPANRVEQGELITKLNDFNSKNFSSGYVTLSRMNASVLHALYRGWLYVQHSTLRAQISPPRTIYSSKKGGSPGDVLFLSRSGYPLKGSRLYEHPAHGIVAFSTSCQAVSARLTLRGLTGHDIVTSITIRMKSKHHENQTKLIRGETRVELEILWQQVSRHDRSLWELQTADLPLNWTSYILFSNKLDLLLTFNTSRVRSKSSILYHTRYQLIGCCSTRDPPTWCTNPEVDVYESTDNAVSTGFDLQCTLLLTIIALFIGFYLT